MRTNTISKARVRDAGVYAASVAMLLLATGCSADETTGAASGTTSPVVSPRRPPTQPPRPVCHPLPRRNAERLVDVGGRTLLVKCVGTGSPTVIPWRQASEVTCAPGSG